MTIRSLRPQMRPDNLKNQVRPGQSVARRLYLGCLIVGVVWIGFIFVGSLIFMDADGLVVQDREVVTPAFAARVTSVAVKPGDAVQQGQVIGTVVSTQMLDLISDLSARQAQVRSRQTQIRARLEAISTILPAAMRRQDDTAAAMSLVDQARQRGYATVTRQSQFSQERYAAVRETASLRAERKALLSERVAIDGDAQRLRTTLKKATDAYRSGDIVAPVGGTVGSTVVAMGTYMSAGENFIEIHHGDKYVMAYLPTDRLYTVQPGEEVLVTDGVNRRPGRIERVEIIADRLPAEFQSSFRGVDRKQVVRVALRPPTSFPVLSKIKVVARNTPSSLFGDAQSYLVAAWADDTRRH